MHLAYILGVPVQILRKEASLLHRLWFRRQQTDGMLSQGRLHLCEIGVIYRKRSGGRARGARRRARGRLASPRTARRAARTLVSRVRLRDEFTSLTVLCQCVSSVSHCSPTGWSLDVASSRGHGSRHTHIATAPLTALLSCYQL
jgi:hypothetical protein